MVKRKFNIIENHGGFANPDFLSTGNAKYFEVWEMNRLKDKINLNNRIINPRIGVVTNILS